MTQRVKVMVPTRGRDTEPPPGEPAARIRVLYADTDAGGVVYHGTYLRVFEAGRTEAVRRAGVGFPRLLEQNLLLPLVEQTIRYRNPAFYDDVLLVYVWVAELKRAQVSFEYEVWRESDGVVVATGRTAHVCFDRARERLAALPDWAVAALRSMRRDRSAAEERG